MESETALGHASLLELLTPVRHRLDDLAAAQSDALASALGWGPAVAARDRYLVAAATLSILAAEAERAPVLVLVDDLQWVDPESAAALLFAARRLRHDAVAFLFATRTGSPLPAPHDGLSVVTLEGLRPEVAAGLLPGSLADKVAVQLALATQGNPLAFAEVAGRLTDAQRIGAAPLPDPLPVAGRLEQLYQPLLAALSPPAWQAVLLSAASRQEITAAPLAALRLAAVDVDAAVAEAEEGGVLVHDRGGLRFRHPLLRTTAWLLATPAQRRAAHQALADAMPGDAAVAARTWHLSEAALGPDDAVADALVAVAADERNRRGFAAASAALERAALLSTDPERAADRLADAVSDAFVAGDVERTRTLAAKLLDGPAGSRSRGRVLSTLGVLEQYAGSVPRAAELLAEAAELAEGPDRVWALAELGLTRFRLSDLAGVGACAEQLAEIADREDPRQRVPADFLRGIALMVAGDPASAVELLVGVIELAQSPALRDDPRHLLYLGLAAGFLGDVRDALVAGEPLLAAARERGALGVLVPALALTAAARAWTGDHRGRVRRCRRGGRARRAARLRGRRRGGGGDARLAVGGAGAPRRCAAGPGAGPGAHRPSRHDQRRRPPGHHGGVLRTVPGRSRRVGVVARGAHRRRWRCRRDGPTARSRAHPGRGVRRARSRGRGCSAGRASMPPCPPARLIRRPLRWSPGASP